jgi:magnesium-transporting ATPase (P-type)
MGIAGTEVAKESSDMNFLFSFLWFPTPQVSVLQPIKSVPCILQNVILLFNLPPQFLILQKCNFCYSIYMWVTLWATQRFLFDSKIYACFFAMYQVVRWGRSVYYNIQKFIQFQLTVNVVALTINLVAAISSGKVPLNAVQVVENLNCEPNCFRLIIWCSSIVEIA